MSYSDATTLQLRRGSNTAVNNFVGAEGEIIVNTNDYSISVHDGATAGGHKVAMLSDIPAIADSITVSGDITGTIETNNDNVSLELTDQENLVAGTYNKVTVNEKGLITAAENDTNSYLTDSASFDIIGSSAGDIAGSVNADNTGTLKLVSQPGLTAGTYNKVTINGQGVVTAAENTEEINLSAITLTNGDIEGTINFDGTATTLDLKDQGITAGTYNKVTVNEKGIITAAENVENTGTADLSAITLADGDIEGTINFDGTATTLNLKDQSLTAGTYNKVTVNEKGIITAAENETIADITVSGDVSGTIDHNTNTASLTLADSGVTAGSYGIIDVDSKGRITKISGNINNSIANAATAGTYNNITFDADGNITAAENKNYVLDTKNVTFAGDVIGTITFNTDNTTVLTLTTQSGLAAGTYNSITVNEKGIVTAATTVESITADDLTDALGQYIKNDEMPDSITLDESGDVTGTINLDDEQKSVLTLATQSGLTAGTYNGITINEKGIVTAATVITNTGSSSDSGSSSNSSDYTWSATQTATNGQYRVLGDDGITVAFTANNLKVTVPAGKKYKQILCNLPADLFSSSSNLTVDCDVNGVIDSAFTSVETGDNDQFDFADGMPIIPDITVYTINGNGWVENGTLRSSTIWSNSHQASITNASGSKNVGIMVKITYSW